MRICDYALDFNFSHTLSTPRATEWEPGQEPLVRSALVVTSTVEVVINPGEESVRPAPLWSAAAWRRFVIDHV